MPTLNFIYGTAKSGKTRISRELECALVDAADRPETEKLTSIFTSFAANEKNIAIDNAHLMTEDEVNCLRELVDRFNISVYACGLKTDTKTFLFEGSKRLLEVADVITETASDCTCGTKAVFNLQVNSNGKIMLYEKTVDPEANYIGVCSKCYKKLIKNTIKEDNKILVRELQDECGI